MKKEILAFALDVATKVIIYCIIFFVFWIWIRGDLYRINDNLQSINSDLKSINRSIEKIDSALTR